jgi:hypothetical protein
MKHTLSILFAAATLGLAAQPKGKEAKMAPVLEPGYYVTAKGDTVKGEIQTNPDDVTGFYTGFSFRPKGGGKVVQISSKKAKAYGFGNRAFVMVPYDEQTDIYLERLVNGRLKFYERKFHDKKEGQPIVNSEYYIQDTRAEEKDAELKEIKGISTKLYKKDLKPYMKDQVTTWNDLDKYVFNREAVLKAINEFNRFYE